ncbi:hypothetical protein BGZ75_000533 [Mortierella antarctica]|nr:hypothetical protein BGZ75_000533 [Mortierella antarctica]
MTMVTASPSSPAAEALLSRARLLSSNAYERTRSAIPTAFAEGEDLIGGSSSLHARTSSSPSLSPITLSAASLHQRHRSSFNDFIRDHNKRRSSVQRLSSGSAASAKAAAQSEHDRSSAVSLGMNATRDEKSSDARDLQSAEGPALTTVVVEPSPNKLLSDPSSSSASSTATPLTPSTSNQSFVDGHTTGAQTRAPSACPTQESPSDPSHTLTISTRPRASTIESTADNRENNPRTPLMEGVPPGSATSTLSPVDLHRKHRSENGSSSGSGLVLGILEVLRDGEKVSVPLHRTPSTPKLAFSGASEPKTEPSQLDHASQPEQSSPAPTPSASATPAAAVVSITTAPQEQQAQPTQETQPATPPAPTSAAPALPTLDTPAPLPPSKPAAPEKGSLTVDTAFLNRKTRSESVSTQGSVESCPSPQAPSPSVKQGRRSSKLFGKLVPKFLQTSFSPSNATGSPRSALPASSSPLSALTTRPGRSASFAGGSSSSMVAGKGLSNGIGSIAEETADKASALPPLPLTLPSLPASVLESGEDWLNTSSSKMQESKHASPPPAPSTCSPSPNKAAEQITVFPAQEQKRQEPIFDYKVEVEYDHELEESAKQERTQEQVHVDAFSTDMSASHERENPASSPYTIDENCDDDFFLNSVLRKKSRPQSPPLLSTGSEAWSAGRTPSLTNSSSSSGSPSPTSPMAPTFGYASTPLSASPVNSLQHHHYQQQQQQQQQPSRSNTYPSSQIHPGIDEKRSRLRDASMSTWREFFEQQKFTTKQRGSASSAWLRLIRSDPRRMAEWQNEKPERELFWKDLKKTESLEGYVENITELVVKDKVAVATRHTADVAAHLEARSKTSSRIGTVKKGVTRPLPTKKGKAKTTPKLVAPQLPEPWKALMEVALALNHDRDVEIPEDHDISHLSSTRQQLYRLALDNLRTYKHDKQQIIAKKDASVALSCTVNLSSDCLHDYFDDDFLTSAANAYHLPTPTNRTLAVLQPLRQLLSHHDARHVLEEARILKGRYQERQRAGEDVPEHWEVILDIVEHV